ncbi:hypothetical protein XELAEV_18043010mg [Xenopus laevis]|uniref:Uncharacterized protein n=1 Tax=Xenopus laevis TaxID=8355 RepID=A0A974C5A4_XENLA|nr:hypothetical protein XELAEV_18043010mg [Xenopus laevis]
MFSSGFYPALYSLCPIRIRDEKETLSSDVCETLQKGQNKNDGGGVYKMGGKKVHMSPYRHKSIIIISALKVTQAIRQRHLYAWRILNNPA